MATNAKQLNPMGWIRLVLYVLSALVGIAAVVTNALGYVDLGALLGTIAGAGAAITGGTAVANLPKAPDQSRFGGFDVRAAFSAINDIADAARVYQDAMAYEGRHQLDEPAPEPYDPMTQYARQVRGE